MRICKPVIIKKSLLAVAIASLGACSTTPRDQDYDLSRIGAGILSAGRTTADISQRAWDNTTYLLGFSDVEPGTDDGLLMDEVDLALMEEDAIMPEQEATASPVIIQSAMPIAEDDVIAVEDLVHEVASKETLWDISKKTTGDANNWHVLADVNNLAPNANVYPGQQLIIPADMVKPRYDDANTESGKQKAKSTVFINTQNLTGSVLKSERPLTDAHKTTAVSEKLEIPTDGVKSVEIAETNQLDGKAFELNAGETLWDFAKRTTGDATNWKAIAGQNNFNEKQSVLVRQGQTIYVPETLVKPELTVLANTDGTPIKADIEKIEVTAAESISQSTYSDAISASSELLAEASTLDETQPIKIVEATFKANKSVIPIAIEESTNDAASVLDSASAPMQIMVSGTYYPKAVYNTADFSSSLLMRVSPGTTLQVSKTIGNWFEVETDKGIGYVHQRDIK